MVKCPDCKGKMIEDIHAPKDGAVCIGKVPNMTTEEFRKMDNWICIDCEIILFREDLNLEE